MNRLSTNKILSLILVLTMIFTALPIGTVMGYTAPGIQLNGEAVDSVVLPRDEKITLALDSDVFEKYEWQISVDKKNDIWVNISGQKQSSVTLSYAMINSLLNSSGETYIRCVVTSENGTTTTEPVKVTVSYVVAEKAKADTDKNTNSATVANAASRMRMARAVYARYASYTITVNFVYENGDIAFEPFAASIEAGGNYTETVDFPDIVGYLPYLGDNEESTDSYKINVKNISSDITYTVTYKPTIVDFKIYHYIQNILDDNYELHSVTFASGLTGNTVGNNRNIDIDGFSMLYYDKDVKIAADGSTEIEIYYDRNYYLMYFDLKGGYGTDPVYTRYGATISVNTPTRAGYVFTGWNLVECGRKNENGNIVYTAATEDEKAKYNLNNASIALPCMNLKYEAVWEAVETTYTVVYWTENANDNNYSYLGSQTGIAALSASNIDAETHKNYPGTWTERSHFTFNEEKSDKAVIVEGDGSTVVNVYYKRNTYTLTFPQTRIACGKEEHRHTYDGSYSTGSGWNRTTYYYGGCYPEGSGDWFNGGSGGATSGNVICGKEEHTHSSSCYGEYTVTAKYDSDITYIWENDPIKSLLGEGYVFKSSVTGKYYSFLEKMPEQNITMTKTEWSGDTYEWYYWLEVLPGQDTSNLETTTSDGRTYYKYHTTTIKGNSIKLTYDEDYFPLTGFSQKDKKGENGWNSDNGTYQHSFNNNRKYDLYYTRKSYDLSFVNYGEKVSGKGGTYLYEQSLSGNNFTPDYPETLEPNAYEFAGWYTTPQCYDGSEFDFTNATMPAHDVELYAKWAPKTHTVRVFKTYGDINSADPIETQYILHSNFADTPKEVSNCNYVFSGWFYMDGTQKKAFDFNSMSIRRDLDVFAEWSSKVAVVYTVNYELEDGTKIADSTIGSTLAGNSKTFSAKGGNELYDGYTEGYFPNTSSHTILMSIDGTNEFTFVYKPIPAVPYTVRYLENGTGKVLAEEKYVSDNRKSVVTEVFKQINGYMPDAYQKRLVLSANEEENVLTFWYTADTEHAYYIITHWIQNIDGDGYEEYRVIQGPGTIGATITEDTLTLSGFNYIGYKVNDSDMKTGLAQGSVAASGLKLDLYYDRILYPYTVKYLENGTNKELSPSKMTEAQYRYGKVVLENAIDIEGYTLVSEKTKTRTIRGTNDVITFYYSEQNVTIKYVPIGSGSVSIGSENVGAVTGSPIGSTPTADDGYIFIGWFIDEKCTTRVDSSWVDGTSDKLLPQKQDGVYKAKTYYAKFQASIADLTIKKNFPKGSDYSADTNQTFVFDIKGKAGTPSKDIDLTITIHGTGEMTIKDLPIGEYTVTEHINWSWRYEPGEQTKTITLVFGEDNEVEFVNSRTEDKWLDGDSYCVNIFKKSN